MPGAKATLLVIEDSRALVMLYQKELGSEGYEVLGCDNWPEALLSMESRHIDLVLTDIHLPGLDASAFIPKIRSLFFDIPVVVISGFESYRTSLTKMAPTVRAFFTKPVEMAVLKRTIAEILDNRLTVEKPHP